MLDYVRLSKTVSHALRHEPWLYELELDDEGWVEVETLLGALRGESPEWKGLKEEDLQEMMRGASKQRYEISGGWIRALYGHSTVEKIAKQPGRPPEFLFHGTSPEVVEVILKDGLRPMGRQYVHCSPDLATARMVGGRKARQPVILRVRAGEAHGAGVVFYVGNSGVWLADFVPGGFLEVLGAERGSASGERIEIRE